MTEELLTVAEVAKRMKVHPETVREWLRTGRMRGYRPGGSKLGWRIRVSEIERFLAASMPDDPKQDKA